MKRLIALIVVSLMLLTGVAASAEVPSFNTAITLNANQVLPMLGLDPASDDAAPFVTIINGLNSMVGHGHIGENGADYAVYLNDVALLNCALSVSDADALAYTSLTPSYVYAFSKELLQEAAAAQGQGQLSANIDPEPYQNMLVEFIMPYMMIQPEEINPDENDGYTSKTTYNLNMDELKAFIVKLGNQLLKDAAANGVQVPYTEIPEDQLPETNGQVVPVEVYSDDTGRMLAKVAGLEDKGTIELEINGTSVNFTFVMGGEGISGNGGIDEAGNFTATVDVMQGGNAVMTFYLTAGQDENGHVAVEFHVYQGETAMLSIYFNAGKDENGLNTGSLDVYQQDDALFLVQYNEHKEDSGLVSVLSLFLGSNEESLIDLYFWGEKEADESHMFAIPEGLQEIDGSVLTKIKDEEAVNEFMQPILQDMMTGGLSALMENINSADAELSQLLSSIVGSMVGA